MSQGIELTYTNGYKCTSALDSEGILIVQLLLSVARFSVQSRGGYLQQLWVSAALAEVI